MFWLNTVKQIIGLFSGKQDPDEIGAGFALGSIIGLTPFNSLHNYVILFLLFLLNVNKGAAAFGIAVFSAIGYFTDPYAHQLGYYLLVNVPSLNHFWTNLYNMPIVPFTHFNNTVVLGSLVISLVLFIPVWLIIKKLTVLYRTKVHDKLVKWKIITILSQSKWYDKYKKIRDTIND
jgi:uncharacterized protein (TIGR03546 family)